MSLMMLRFIFLFWICVGQCQDISTNENQINNTILDHEKYEHKLAHSINDFGYKILLKTMEENKNENMLISPSSISGMLAMALLGSVGKTYDELANALGFSQDVLLNRQNHNVFGNLLRTLNSNDSTTKTSFADAVFVDIKSSLRNVYGEYLSYIYEGKAINVDFSREEEVKQTINEWVKKRTEGNIDNFLKETLPRSTKTVLLSAMYFNGQWERPFIPELTAEMSFKTPTKVVNATLMLNYGKFEYFVSYKDGLHIVALPYKDKVTKMYVLMPKFPDTLSLYDLMSRLDYAKIDDLTNKMEVREAIIRLPKMELYNHIELKNVLKSIGIDSMFAPGKANFALMIDGNNERNKTEELIIKARIGKVDGSDLKARLNSLPNPGVYIDSVPHDVRMTIDEFGTVAAAVTAGYLARTVVTLYTESPFYIFIRNEKTKLVTFSAVIFDPTK